MLVCIQGAQFQGKKVQASKTQDTSKHQPDKEPLSNRHSASFLAFFFQLHLSNAYRGVASEPDTKHCIAILPDLISPCSTPGSCTPQWANPARACTA